MNRKYDGKEDGRHDYLNDEVDSVLDAMLEDWKQAFHIKDTSHKQRQARQRIHDLWDRGATNDAMCGWELVKEGYQPRTRFMNSHEYQFNDLSVKDMKAVGELRLKIMDALVAYGRDPIRDEQLMFKDLDSRGMDNSQ
ncbi:MAG: hypothetical protein FWE16_01565 [Firmicutes bacterium]|nr:hypothetical protein [Bacillota bacterium]